MAGLSGCEDHRIPALSRLRVKSLSQSQPGNASRITSFAYDAQGKISSFIVYQSPDSTTTPVERNTYQYDAQNRLVRHQRQVSSPPGFIFGPFNEQNQFTYDAAGKLTELRYSTSNYKRTTPDQRLLDLAVLANDIALTDVVRYQYDGTGKLASSTLTNYFQGKVNPLFARASQYALTGDNVTFVSTTTTGPNYSSTETNQYVYDNNINPFYGIYVIPKFYGGTTNINTFSRNNVVSVGGVSYRYEYNEAKLPTVRYTITDRVIETLRYEYEVY